MNDFGGHLISLLCSFLSFRKTHTEPLKNLMVDIVSVIMAEYESIPFALLELLFGRIIDPEKVWESPDVRIR